MRIHPLALMSLLALLATNCTRQGVTGGPTPEPSASVVKVVEQTKDSWARATKPLEITLRGRTQEECTQIETVAVLLSCGTTVEAVPFHYDGSVFRSKQPVLVDSLCEVDVFYPYSPNLQRGSRLTIGDNETALMYGEGETVTDTGSAFKMEINMVDALALLSVRVESDNVDDRLSSIDITGLGVSGDVKLGEILTAEIESKCSRSYDDVNLSYGTVHNFFVIPTNEQSEITITLVVNGESRMIRTTIPPLREQSLTELSLKITGKQLAIGSSWVDTKHPFITRKKMKRIAAEVGMYLMNDGTISEEWKENALALVLETDGAHGKAIGLKDVDDAVVFDSRHFSTGSIYDSVDGIKSEGYLQTGADTVSSKHPEEMQLLYSPKVRYSSTAAFSVESGVTPTSKIIKSLDETRKELFLSNKGRGQGYIPSLAEMVRLVWRNRQMLIQKEIYGFQKMEGSYMTCVESGPEMFYSINPVEGIITGYNSKTFHNCHLRMIYLF